MADSEDTKYPPTNTSERKPKIGSLSAEEALLSGSEEGLRGLVLAERYQILEKLGSGGWGTVYKGKHLTLERLVAIKVLHTHMANDEKVRKRFEHEANILTRVDSRYVVKTIDLIFEPVPYIVMEYFPGIPLSNLLAKRGKLEFPLAVELFRQICEGLQAAHAAGLVHRDLKPANILVEIDGNSLKSKILDFGIARMLDEGVHEKLTSTGEVLGSPPFMAPEQWSGRGVDQRTDIYAFGCIMYQVICGRQAFTAEYGLDYLNKHLHAELASFESVLGETAKEIPTQFELLVRKCMAQTKERRYSSASEILRDIELIRSGKRIRIKDERSKKKPLRNTIIVASAATILLGTFAAGYLQRETLIAAYCKKLNEEADVSRKSPAKQAQAEEKYRNVISLSNYLTNAQDKNKLHAMHSLTSLLKLQKRLKDYTDLNKQLLQVTGENQSPAAKELARFAGSLSSENLQASEQTERKILEKIAKQVGRHSIDYAAGLAVLSQCKKAEKDYKAATQYGQKSLKILEDLLEPDDPRIADQLFLLGNLMKESMQTKEAEQIFLRLIGIAQKSCPDRLANAYNELGLLCFNQNKVDKAVNYFQLATENYVIHNDKAGNAKYEYNLARALRDQKYFEHSLQAFKKVQEIEKSKGRTTSSEYLNSLHGIAEIYIETYQYPESEEYMLKAIEAKKRFSEYGPSLVVLYRKMSFVCLRLGKERESQLFQKLAESSSAASATGSPKPAPPR